jgi:hypothetical protein
MIRQIYETIKAHFRGEKRVGTLKQTGRVFISDKDSLGGIVKLPLNAKFQGEMKIIRTNGEVEIIKIGDDI